MTFYDVIDQQKDVSVYQRHFFLWKEQWDSYIAPSITLDWKCVKFNKNNTHQIPTKKGIYAFFIEPRIVKFPSHGYLLYLGQTGYKGERNLQIRFRDYLYYKKNPKRRRVHLMLNTWEDYLYFYFAEVDVTQTDLRLLEQNLLDTFTPPFVDRGYSTMVKDVIKGLR